MWLKIRNSIGIPCPSPIDELVVLNDTRNLHSSDRCIGITRAPTKRRLQTSTVSSRGRIVFTMRSSEKKKDSIDITYVVYDAYIHPLSDSEMINDCRTVGSDAVYFRTLTNMSDVRSRDQTGSLTYPQNH